MSASNSSRSRVGLFIDLENVRRSLDAAAYRSIDAPDIGARIYSFASTRGRVVLANVYAEWTAPRALGPRDFRRQQIEPRFCLRREASDRMIDLTMALDVMESLHQPCPVDEYILVTGEVDYLELVQRLRKHDRSVVVCGIRSIAAPELVRSADHFVPLEDVLLLPPASGSGVEASIPQALSGSSGVFDEQDVSALILLINRLEERLDFVGVGYLIGKAMGHNAVGPEDIRLRRMLFNKLADEGIVEVYKLENKEAGADPVSACRLNHDHPRVQEILAREDEDGGDDDEDGLEGGYYEEEA